MPTGSTRIARFEARRKNGCVDPEGEDSNRSAAAREGRKKKRSCVRRGRSGVRGSYRCKFVRWGYREDKITWVIGNMNVWRQLCLTVARSAIEQMHAWIMKRQLQHVKQEENTQDGLSESATVEAEKTVESSMEWARNDKVPGLQRRRELSENDMEKYAVPRRMKNVNESYRLMSEQHMITKSRF